MYRNLPEVLNETAHHYPERKAFIYLKDGEMESVSCTYRELLLQSQALAGYFQYLGLEGERIMILLPSGIDYIISFLASLYAKAIPIPVYPPSKSRNAERIAAIYADSTPALIITPTPQDADKLPSSMQAAHIIQLNDIMSCNHLFYKHTESIPSEDIAFLQYTSGSTSSPKGVMVSHRNLHHNFAMMQQRFEHAANTIMATWLPIYHDMGLIGNVLQNIYNGGTCYLMSPLDFIQKPIRWLRAISKFGVTFSGGPDFAYRLCIQKISQEEKAALDLSSWTNAFNGAEPVRAETIRQFVDQFGVCGFQEQAMMPSYGLAEGTLCVTVGSRLASPNLLLLNDKAMQKHQVLLEDNTGPGTRLLVGCGQISAHQQIKIVEPFTKVEHTEGEIGEIWIKGDSVAQGYWGAPVASADTFAACLSDTGGGPYLRTGDLGFIHEGELFITGRLKDLIIIRGQNYYPQDIEQIAAGCHSEINAASTAAFSIDVQGKEELVILCEMNREFKHVIQRKQLDLAASLNDIAQNIQMKINEQFQLHAHDIKIVKPLHIPKTSSNKIQRHKCKQMYLSGSLIAWGG
ncbi:fatty acyl-AMP ligase [Paenibacillus sp. UMB4589-SE434]|uniref:fatty acyl-AMP ligase n=1 Tax=Paenibacillus sp. UMB4589-SE434 TaxID=3046314 RepID=UPI00254D925B|nr:fatty acyl-AMP ligase [Paenibacillus sp. UMB4589-SE434]MDK8182715.1 fatty acyl-AMP ligase [Paenibacillus sp. UMB4589-SE434]